MNKVVRIVNLPKYFNDDMIKNFITFRVQLSGEIKKTYIRKDEYLNLYFAYVVFETHLDALKTVNTIHGFFCDNKQLDLLLIGPAERYVKNKNQTVNVEEVISSTQARHRDDGFLKRQQEQEQFGRRHGVINQRICESMKSLSNKETVNAEKFVFSSYQPIHKNDEYIKRQQKQEQFGGRHWERNQNMWDNMKSLLNKQTANAVKVGFSTYQPVHRDGGILKKQQEQEQFGWTHAERNCRF